MENRLDWIDQHGTRQVSQIAFQITELSKDIGELKSGRFTNWLVYLATILPLYGLVIAVFIQHVP